MGSPFRQQSPQDEPEDNSWMETYADAITLLMAFFVILYAMSEIDKDKFQEVSAGIVDALSGESQKDGRGKEGAYADTKSREVAETLKETLKADIGDGTARVKSNPKGITLKFNNSTLYRIGSAELREGVKPKLKRVADYLAKLDPKSFRIDVEGHTDDVPIRTPRFPSNWELSAARSTAVVRFFIGAGLDPTKLRALGFADTRPKKPNRYEDGRAIPLNQAMNRRVVVKILRY